MKNPDRRQHFGSYIDSSSLTRGRGACKTPKLSLPIILIAAAIAGVVAFTVSPDSQKQKKPSIESKVILADPDLDQDLNCILERFNQLCTGVVNTDWVVDNCNEYLGAYPLMDDLARVVPFRDAVLDKAGDLDGVVTWKCEEMDTTSAHVVQIVNEKVLSKLSSEQRKNFNLR